MRVSAWGVYRQAVFLDAGDDRKVSAGGAALDLEIKGQRLVGILKRANVLKRAVQIDLCSQQAKGFISQRKPVHAACPPLFGSNGAGRLQCGTSLGLQFWRMTKQPVVACNCSISRRLLAHVGWTCRVAVVCMVLPRSVVGE